MALEIMKKVGEGFVTSSYRTGRLGQYRRVGRNLLVLSKTECTGQNHSII